MATGTFTTYDLSVGVKLDFEDYIYQLSPYDVPLLGTYDPDGRQTTLARGTVTQKLYQWSDEEILTPRSLVAGGGISNVATALVVTTGQGIRFGTGDILRLEAEVVRVTSVATDTLTVVRGYGGTTGAAHAAGVVVVGIGQALPEGSDPPTARAVDRTGRSNYTEIFGPLAVQTSGTEDVVQKYGVPGTEFDKQVANRLKEVAISTEQAILYGIAYEDAGNKWRSMGGMQSFIASHVDSSTTALTEGTLIDLNQAVYDDGGTPDRIVVGSKQKRVISGFNSTLIRYPQEGNVRGQVVEWYDSDFGRQAVVLDRWCRTSDLFLFNRDQAEVCWLRPMQFEMLAKTGDSTKGQVVGEAGFKFYRERHAGRFSALT